MVLAMVLVS